MRSGRKGRILAGKDEGRKEEKLEIIKKRKGRR